MKLILTCLPVFNHIFTPSLPLAYLKAYVQQCKGVEVKALDFEPKYFASAAIKNSSLLYWDKIWSRDYDLQDRDKPILDTFIQQILVEKPDVVGFSVAHSNFIFTRYVSQEIKRRCPEIYIIYGGRYFCLREPWRYWVAQWHKSFFEVDCIVKNEGEETLKELVDILKNDKRPQFCKGSTIRLKDAIIDGGNRKLIENLDSIPFPDYSDFPKKDYLSDYLKIVFSRGCIGQCTYCVENDTMGSFRYRSPDNITQELKLRLSQGYRKFQLCDLALNSRIEPLMGICRKIIKDKLDIEFIFSEFRNSPHLTQEVFNLLYKAGFRSICFGTESASQIVLDRMKKGVRVETIGKNFQDAHKAGLKVILYLMTGFPGETEETFSQTLEMLKQYSGFIDGVAAIAPTEICGGSSIQDNLNNYGLKEETLFKYPDIWESKDGQNSFSWRHNLAERIHQCLRDLKIPMVSFSVDGNPRVLIPKPKGFPFKSKNETKKPSLKSSFSLKEKLNYRAQLRIIENISSNNGIIVLLEVKNISDKQWCNGQSDWIRVGCKIYDAQIKNNLPVVELRRDLLQDINSGESFQVVFRITNGLLSKGNYLFKFDIVNEGQFWFEELGSIPLVERIQI